MTTYYVDSVHGSDKNSGSTAGQAIQSIEKLESIKLHPGDTVLFARGSTFTSTYNLTSSGTAGHPITLGAYGTGDAPTFTTAADGIHASKTSNINVQDLNFAHSGGAAIYGGNVSNWNIKNVSIVDTGLQTGIGGLVFKSSASISVSGSTFNGVHGDGIYVERINGLTISGNNFSHLAGAAADGIQATDSSNITIAGNTIDMSTSPNSTKGGVALNGASHATLTDNTVIGGSFGLGLNGEYITATHNDLIGQKMYGWSSGILIGETADVSHYIIEDNAFSNSNFGVSLTGIGTSNATRDDIQISGNLFDKMSSAALKIDRPSTGSFHDNIITNTATHTLVKGAGIGTYHIEDTTTPAQTVTPVVTPPVVTPTPSDHVSLPETPAAPVVTPQTVADHSADVTPAPTPTTSTVTTPAVTPVTPVSTATHAPVAVDDRFVMSDHLHTLTGNILANDHDLDGDNLLVRFVAGTRIDAGTQKIAGLYGTLTIDSTGQFVYLLDESKADHATFTKGVATDSFQYKISDGSHQDTGNVSFQILEHHDYFM